MNKKVVIGLSGGVDSSVSAYILKERGYEVIGVTMQIWEPEDSLVDVPAVVDAKKVADAIGIEHHVINFYDEFRKEVKSDFVKEYLEGRTPNPCIICNNKVKWEALLSKARQYGADCVATGHYASVVNIDDRYSLHMADNIKKDQTYALYRLTQDQLKRTIMPLGEFSKEEVRDMASSYGIPVADKPDSMEICFVPDNDYAGFIERDIGKKIPCGNYVDKYGKILGTHKGIIHYTVGQRKGLDIACGRRVFVTGINPVTNEVILGEDKDLYVNEIEACRVNFMGIEDFAKDEVYIGKIRYNHAGAPCRACRMEDGRIKVSFIEPVRAATPGQSVVLYRDGYIAAGGIII